MDNDVDADEDDVGLKSNLTIHFPISCQTDCFEKGYIYVGNPLKKPGTSGLYLYLYQILGFEAAEAGHKGGGGS